MNLPRAAHGLQLVATRSNGAMDEVARAVAGARSRVSGEHFVLTDVPVVQAMQDAADRGVRGTLLADPEMVQLGQFHAPARFAVTPHGGLDHKVHTKLTNLDGELSLFSTTGMSAKHREEPHIDFLFRSHEAAAVLEELSLAAASGDKARIAAAAQRAADAGFLLNDPANGVLHLRSGLKALADAATGDAYVGSKVLNDHKLLGRLRKGTDAAGGQLRVETHGGTKGGKAGRAQAQRAGEKVGVEVHRVKRNADGVDLHANVMVVQTAEGPRMVVMTAPFTHRGLGEDGAAKMGRELGVVIDDPAIMRRVLTELGTLKGSKASEVADRLLAR